jgi:acetyltransferase-like isoleucine patch superfamily enzyme
MNNPQIKNVGIVDVDFGIHVTIVQPVNLYGCRIGDNCFIGPFVEIQKDVIIGSGCKIQSHSFICEMVQLGDDCVVAHGVMFINDLFKIGGPAKNNRNLWMPTSIGNRVSIGSNATILPVSICDDVVVGAGSVVTHDIVEPGIYAGNPARKLRSLTRSIDRNS